MGSKQHAKMRKTAHASAAATTNVATADKVITLPTEKPQPLLDTGKNDCQSKTPKDRRKDMM